MASENPLWRAPRIHGELLKKSAVCITGMNDEPPETRVAPWGY